MKPMNSDPEPTPFRLASRRQALGWLGAAGAAMAASACGGGSTARPTPSADRATPTTPAADGATPTTLAVRDVAAAPASSAAAGGAPAVNGTTHISQLFFPEAMNDTVYADAPYNGHAGRRTLNAQDGIYGGGGSATTLALAGAATGYVGAMNLGVRR